jgi:hypothetical protein
MDIQNGKIEIISFVANIFLENPPSSLSLFSRIRVAQTLVILHGVFFHHYLSFSRFYFSHCTAILWFTASDLHIDIFQTFFFNIFEIVYLQQIRPLLKLDLDNYFKCFT